MGVNLLPHTPLHNKQLAPHLTNLPILLKLQLWQLIGEESDRICPTTEAIEWREVYWSPAPPWASYGNLRDYDGGNLHPIINPGRNHQHLIWHVQHPKQTKWSTGDLSQGNATDGPWLVYSYWDQADQFSLDYHVITTTATSTSQVSHAWPAGSHSLVLGDLNANLQSPQRKWAAHISTEILSRGLEDLFLKFKLCC